MVALKSAYEQIADFFRMKHFFRPWVEPVLAEIDPNSGEDKRPENQRELALEIHLSEIVDVRTIAMDEAFGIGSSVNNVKHAWLIQGSPLTTDGLLYEDKLDEYRARYKKTRVGRRMVNVSISSSGKPDRVNLDFWSLSAKRRA